MCNMSSKSLNFSKIARAQQVAKLIRNGIETPNAIIDALNQANSAFYLGKSHEAQKKALQRDIKRLQKMGLHFKFDLKQGKYCEIMPPPEDSGEGLNSLTFDNDELIVLAQLRDLHRFTPYAATAQRLCNKLTRFLTAQQRTLLEKRPLINMQIPLLDMLTEHIETAHIVEKAFMEQRDLEFLYHTPKYESPYLFKTQVLAGLELRDGHVYFEAWSLNSDGFREFRLDRIVKGSARLLPNKRPRRTGLVVKLTLQYQLDAHLSPTQHFVGQTAEKQADGSHLVTAIIDERQLFRAEKTLLRYGDGCKVISPPELVARFRTVVAAMMRRYE